MDTFAILNIIALATLAGTITGLVIGYAAKRQQSTWSSMAEKDKRVNFALVLFFIVIYAIVLFWYVMNPAPATFP